MAPFSLLKHRAAPAPSFAPALSRADEPAIPDPAVFTSTPLAASPLPTVSQCAVHLALLQAFTRLRQRAAKEATVFGAEDTRWRAFVEAAVGRFETWWWGADAELQRRAGEKKKEEEVEEVDEEGLESLPVELLPPLDVLMVWHAYMLNPRCYNEDSLHFGLRRILHVGFPWELVHAAIDMDHFGYTLPEPAARFFTALTAQSPSLLDELLVAPPTKRLRCPRCGKADVDVRICDEKPGAGWLDEAFAVECAGCGGVVDKEGLCAAKFAADVDVFLEAGDEGRMRMTRLDTRGHAYPTDASSATWESASATNTFFRSAATPRVLSSVLSSVLPSPSHTLRLCLAAYTTTSRFSLDLAAAVLRQSVFVSKMHDQLWLRSPGLLGTLPVASIAAVRARGPSSCVLVSQDASDTDGFLARAVHRYVRFFELFRVHPGQTLVPTLDVDLVWHSAMLTPVLYRGWCRGAAGGRFVGHDDALGKGVLSGGFEFTEAAYRAAFGSAYARCCCWFCETAANEGLQREGAEGARRKWWRWRRRGERAEESAVRAVRVRVEFYREVERRRRAGTEGLAREGLLEVLEKC